MDRIAGLCPRETQRARHDFHVQSQDLATVAPEVGRKRRFGLIYTCKACDSRYPVNATFHVQLLLRVCLGERIPRIRFGWVMI